jgi:hypothetical protein
MGKYFNGNLWGEREKSKGKKQINIETKRDAQ